MYLDMQLTFFQVTRSLYNVQMDITNESGELVRRKTYERVSMTSGYYMAAAALKATHAMLGDQSQRGDDPDTPVLFQEELPF